MDKEQVLGRILKQGFVAVVRAEGAGWFHFTGITPALGDGVAGITENACKKAKEKGMTVSCDLNYRKKLWSREKADQVMGGLMEYVGLAFTAHESISTFTSLTVWAGGDASVRVQR